MTSKIKLALILTILLWASSFVAIRAGLHSYSPEGMALLRFLVASFCISIIYFRLPNRSPIKLKDMLALFLVGAIGIGVYNITLNYGEVAISSGVASFIISQSPILTTIFALLFLGEKLTVFRVIGFMVSVIGIVLIAISQKGVMQWNAGLLDILIATIIGAGFSVLQKPFLKKYHAIEVTTFIIWGGTLFLTLYTSKLEHDIVNASLSATLTIIYLGIFPATIGYLAWSYVLTEVPASRAASFLYFMPFLATIIGWIWLGELPAWLAFLGGLLAISGVGLVNHSYHAKKV